MKFTTIIEELKSLSENGIFSRAKIEWWLLKYNEKYNLYNTEDRNRTGRRITYSSNTNIETVLSIDLENEINVFLDTYDVLDKVSKLYRNESYFKQELNVYDDIKNDVKKLDSWLKLHKADKKEKYRGFVSMFQNNTTLSGYRLKVFSFSAPFDINLDELDFKYTLQFLKIIDKANTVEVIGTVRIINDIESVKRNGLPNYDKQIIIVHIDNGHGTELRIVFLHQKVQLLKNLKVGQEIKIYTELLGGKDESVNFGYSLQIRGWDIEILKN